MLYIKYISTKLCLIAATFLLAIPSSRAQTRVDQIRTHLSNPQDKSVLVAAHRGDWFWAPENSLTGFQNCIDMGVDMIELDVRLSKDGIPVVIHDETLERTTTGRGKVANYTVDSLKTFFLKDATGVVTKEKIPTLEEACRLTKDHILIYLDKSVDKVDKILPVLEKTNTIQQAVFVLDFPYAEAKSVFGDRLEQVLFIPVITDDLPELRGYVKDYLTNLKPVAFQFRMKRQDGPAFSMLKFVVNAHSKAFVAATWADHTIGHDDQLSRIHPDKGWGWLIDHGFTLLETNRPQQLLEYLRTRALHH